MLQIKSFTFNPFQENTYLLYDESLQAVLIDPGCHTAAERKEVTEFIQGNNLKPTLLLNTHCHIDHVLGNEWVKNTYNIPLLIHRLDLPVLKSVEAYASNYGFHGYSGVEPDGFLEEGEFISVGSEKLKVIFVPGHAPGHVVFYHAESHLAIGGDTLFRGSIGRTDLPGGDHQLLLNKIKSELFTLPDQTVVYPGHGPETTIAYEKSNNPFVGKNARY